MESQVWECSRLDLIIQNYLDLTQLDLKIYALKEIQRHSLPGLKWWLCINELEIQVFWVWSRKEYRIERLDGRKRNKQVLAVWALGNLQISKSN